MPGCYPLDTVFVMENDIDSRTPRARRWFQPALALAAIATIVAAALSLNVGQAQEAVEAAPQPVPQEPQSLVTPPPGGLTLGFAGTTSPLAVIEAQPFGVAGITVIDRATQQFLVYIPGAPDFVNSLNDQTLTPDAVVIVRRDDAGDEPVVATSRARTAENAGKPFALAAPPEGGLTMGMAGTTDPDVLVAAQSFEVKAVALFDIAEQRWLIFVPGAPEGVNTLSSESLKTDSFVAIRSVSPVVEVSQPAEAADEPQSVGRGDSAAEQPHAGLRSLGTGRISVYYCEGGPQTGRWGDGGGWCGHFASGKRVYEGGAACAREYRGQRFKIAGDPLDRTYVCEDTGGAVHGNTRDIFFWNSDDAQRWTRVVGTHAEVFVVE